MVASGDERAPKHLGSPEVADGCGATVAAAVKKVAHDWGIGVEKDGVLTTPPVCCIYDTTAANSG